MKNVHTLFDYISPRDSDDRKVGWAAAGWNTGGDKVGIPPSLLIADIDAIKARSFVDHLFYAWEDCEELSVNLKFLFAGSIMRYVFDFERIVRDHPAGIFDDPWQQHTFLRRIFAAANEAGWNKDDLKKASKVDARTITSHMEDSLRLMTSIQQTQMQHSAGINAMSTSSRDIEKVYEDLRDEIKSLREENKSLREENKSLRDNNMWLRDEMRMINGTMTNTTVGEGWKGSLTSRTAWSLLV